MIPAAAPLPTPPRAGRGAAAGLAIALVSALPAVAGEAVGAARWLGSVAGIVQEANRIETALSAAEGWFLDTRIDPAFAGEAAMNARIVLQRVTPRIGALADSIATLGPRPPAAPPVHTRSRAYLARVERLPGHLRSVAGLLAARIEAVEGGDPHALWRVRRKRAALGHASVEGWRDALAAERDLFPADHPERLILVAEHAMLGVRRAEYEYERVAADGAAAAAARLIALGRSAEAAARRAGAALDAAEAALPRHEIALAATLRREIGQWAGPRARRSSAVLGRLIGDYRAAIRLGEARLRLHLERLAGGEETALLARWTAHREREAATIAAIDAGWADYRAAIAGDDAAARATEEP